MQCIFVRRSMIVLLIAFLAQAIHCQVPAGEQPHIAGKPVTAVASFAGYTAMMDDIKMIEQLTDNPKLRTMITASVAMATGGEGLTGLDHRRPWGLAVYGLEDDVLAFIPAVDASALISTFARFRNETLEESVNGTYRFTNGDRPFFLTARGNLLLASTSEHCFDDCPENPYALLGDLPDEFDVAARVFVNVASEKHVSLASHTIKTTFEQSLLWQAANDEGLNPLAKPRGGPALETIMRHVGEIEQVTFGWQLDESQQKAVCQLSFTAIEGTSLARKSQLLQVTPSRFAGFVLPDATISGNITSLVNEQTAKHAESFLNSLKIRAIDYIKTDEFENEASRAVAAQTVEGLCDEALATLKDGSLDAATSIVATDGRFRFIAAFNISDDARVERMLKRIVVTNPNISVSWNAFTHRDIRVHRFVVPANEALRETFGDDRTVLVGLAPQSCHLAMGADDPTQALVAAIEQSLAQGPIPLPTIRLSASINDLLQIAGEEFAWINDIWQQYSEADQMHIVLEPIDGGLKYRVELERGVIAAFCRSVIERTLVGAAIQN